MMIKAFGEVMMRLDVPGHLKLEQTRTLHVSYTGTGVNVLSALSRFGHQTSLITKLPDNSLGDAALAYIRSLGIGTQDVCRGGKYLGKYFLENGFSVRPAKVTYSNRQESSFCTASLHDYHLDDILKDTTLIHFCGITLAVSDDARHIALKMAEKAKQRGITVVFDCNYRPKLWENQYAKAQPFYEAMLQLTDICFMTEKDAKLLLDIDTDKTDRKEQMEDLLTQAAEKFAIHTIAGTIRKAESKHQVIQGFIHHRTSFVYSREYVYETLDRIGAGDGFAGGIIHGFLHSLSMHDMIEFATASSVLAHTTYGDAPICSTEEVWTLVKNGTKTDIER
ncbi:MAG TPA: sugar kinase [Bacillota bacterium]|nr:sugar kinase [Bacillota bacterium]